MVTIERGADVYRYHRNHLYSVTALTDATGAVVERYGYDAYGDSVVTEASGMPLSGNESSLGNPYRFTGRRLDGETGLMYFRARYYSGELGRFVNRDPYQEALDSPTAGDGYPAGYNLYHHSDAQNMVDPWGLNPEPPECDSFTVLCQIKEPDSNGCGPGGWKGKLVPEMPLWMVDFGPPCDNHDKCYATCGTTQEYCDEEFRTDLEAQCWLKFGWMSIKPMPRDLRIKMTTCLNLGKVYAAAVRAAGKEHHAAAQKEYCGCCCGPVEDSGSSGPLSW